MHNFGSSYMDYVYSAIFHAYIYLNLVLYMVHDPLVSGLCGIIPGGISVEDYAIATSTDHVSAKSMLLDLVENQIGVQEKQSFEFNDGDRLRAAILCLQRVLQLMMLHLI